MFALLFVCALQASTELDEITRDLKELNEYKMSDSDQKDIQEILDIFPPDITINKLFENLFKKSGSEFEYAKLALGYVKGPFKALFEKNEEEVLKYFVQITEPIKLLVNTEKFKKGMKTFIETNMIEGIKQMGIEISELEKRFNFFYDNVYETKKSSLDEISKEILGVGYSKLYNAAFEIIKSKEANINIITQDRANIIKEVLAIPYNIIGLLGQCIKGVMGPISELVNNKDLKANAQKAADKCDAIIKELGTESENAIIFEEMKKIFVSLTGDSEKKGTAAEEPEVPDYPSESPEEGSSESMVSIIGIISPFFTKGGIRNLMLTACETDDERKYVGMVLDFISSRTSGINAELIKFIEDLSKEFFINSVMPEIYKIATTESYPAMGKIEFDFNKKLSDYLAFEEYKIEDFLKYLKNTVSKGKIATTVLEPVFGKFYTKLLAPIVDLTKKAVDSLEGGKTIKGIAGDVFNNADILVEAIDVFFKNADNIVKIKCQLINIQDWANNLVSLYSPKEGQEPVWDQVVKRPIYDILRSFEGQGKITSVFPIIADMKTVFEVYPTEKSRTALAATASFDYVASSVASVGDVFQVNPIGGIDELAGDFVAPAVSKEGNINAIGHEILKCDIVNIVGEVLPVVSAVANGEKIKVDELKAAVESIKKDSDSIASAGDSYQESYEASAPNSGLTGGEIAGIVIGVIAGVAVIVGIIVFFVLRNKNKVNNEEQDEKQSP